MRTRTLALGLLAAAGFSSVAPAAAAGQLAVDSMVRTLRLSDGPALDVQVRNLSRHATRVEVEFADWEVTAEGEHRFHPPGTRPESCGQRVRVEPPAANLAGDGAAMFRLVHAGAERGACRIMVWFRSDDLPLDDEEGVSFIIRTGVKAYIEP